MQIKVATVAEYLQQVPADRREMLQKVRQVILENLDAGFEEGMQYGMIGYFVPHRLYPAGYHCDPKQPLPFAGLASQKNYCSVYLMGIYAEADHAEWFEEAWRKTGRKLDMGKCCVRFRKLEDVSLELIGESIARIPLQRFIEIYEATRPGPTRSGQRTSKSKTKAAPSVKKPAKKPARKKATKRR